MVDLSTLFPPHADLQLDHAFYINDRGEIAARGTFSNGDTHSLLLIPCDENHPDVEGCDYDTIDAETAAAHVSSALANQPPTELAPRNRMRGMNRFRGIQHAQGLRSQAPDRKQAPLANSNGDWMADHTLAPLYGHHPGYCGTNSSGLTGLCAAYSYTNACAVGRSTACPRGQKAKKPAYYRCSLMQKIFVDLGTSCAF